MSWKTCILEFDNTALPDAIRAISHHYKREIILNEEISACRLSSTFNNETIQDVLDQLTIILQLRILHQENTIILLGKGC